MVVAQLVNHYETLHNDYTSNSLPPEPSRQNVTVQFHSAPLQELRARKSQQDLKKMDNDVDDSYGAGEGFDEPLLEPSLHIEIESDSSELETRKRSSSVSTLSRTDSKDLDSNSSSSSLPCLSRSSSVNSTSAPTTPRKEIAAFLSSSDEEILKLLARELPSLLFTSEDDLSKSAFCDPREEVQTPTQEEPHAFKAWRDKGKGKAPERPVSQIQANLHRQSMGLDLSSVDVAALAGQAHSDLKYTLAGRQFQSQLNLSYMPTIHENFQTLPFLDEDTSSNRTKRSRPKSIAPEHFHRRTGATIEYVPSQPAALPSAPAFPVVSAMPQSRLPSSKPESIKSFSTTATGQSKSSNTSVKQSFFRGLKRYYFGDPEL